MICIIHDENKNNSVTIVQDPLSNVIDVSMSNKMNLLKCSLIKYSTRKLILTKTTLQTWNYRMMICKAAVKIIFNQDNTVKD